MIKERLSPQAIAVLCRHKTELKTDIDDINMLPLFIDALQTGGLKLFDEIRYALEFADIEIKDDLFNK